MGLKRNVHENNEPIYSRPPSPRIKQLKEADVAALRGPAQIDESAAGLGSAVKRALDVNPACEVASRKLYKCRRRLFFFNKCLQRYRLDTVKVSRTQNVTSL
ncbi:hypothetical protein V3C99_000425 [Haemonchus contortus]